MTYSSTHSKKNTTKPSGLFFITFTYFSIVITFTLLMRYNNNHTEISVESYEKVNLIFSKQNPILVSYIQLALKDGFFSKTEFEELISLQEAEEYSVLSQKNATTINNIKNNLVLKSN